jgi:pimeloyl-ACP methyl ester carboxylesterase
VTGSGTSGATAAAVRLARVAVLIGVAACATLAGAASAAALNMTGTWKANYHCEAGWCAGGDSPATDVLTQAEGSSVVTGSNGSESISGTLSGNTFNYTSTTGGYEAKATLTVSADGLSWTGPATDNNGTSGIYTATREATMATISGNVADQNAIAAPGVKLKLTGTSDAEKEVTMTATADAQGNYSFEVERGKYTVSASGEPTEQNGGKQNGGTLAVRKQTFGAHDPECPGKAKEAECALNHIGTGETAQVKFAYFQCSATDRLPNGKPPTHCPIIFIPGFLGSRISCGDREMWTALPSPDFADLQLKPDGETNSGAPGSCAAEAKAGEQWSGVVATAAGKDIYGAALSFLGKLAPSDDYALPYDWRKSPLIAKEALEKLVPKVLEEQGAKRVVLIAHSMGGLVLQSYIANSANAEKVVRAVTLGTPYWGAVKSHASLLTGKSNEIAQETFGLDLFIKRVVAEEEESSGSYNSSIFATDLQLAARNMQGLYWLYPADEYGPWLQVTDRHYPLGFMKTSQIRPWVTSLGGSPGLVTNAVNGHTAITGYPSNNVDFQVVAGAGTPTEAALKVEENPTSVTQPVTVWYASGDGTVPLVSATEGASEGKSVPIPVHYVCRVDHVALTGNATVQKGIEGFLLKGEAITGLDDNCPYTGVAMKIFEPVIPEHGKAAIGASAQPKKAAKGPAVTVQTSTGAISLGEAAERGLVTKFQDGGVTFIADTNSNPVTVNVTGSSVGVSVQSIKSGGRGNESGSGPSVLYGPVHGSITIGPAGTVKHGKKTLRPVHDRKSPHTTARVSRHGKRVRVTLKAHSAVGITATFVRIGKGPARAYRGPFLIKASQLKSLRFESVDRFGYWERPQRVHR